MADKDKTGLIYYFANHRLAANLLMVIIFLVGVWATLQLNTQLLPSFRLNAITIRIAWPGASPSDVEDAITKPVEDALRSIPKKKEMTSTMKSLESRQDARNVMKSRKDKDISTRKDIHERRKLEEKQSRATSGSEKQRGKHNYSMHQS